MKKAVKKLESQLELIAEKMEQMESTFDERTEAWQESEKGELWRERIDSLQNAHDSLEEAIDSLKEFILN